MPKVSVIIPCYNQGGYVDEAVDSVLAQKFEDYEIIVVNDGSTDKDTEVKLKAYDKPKTRVVHSENKGLAGARNLGIKNAEGEYILPLDADDRIGPDYLAQAVEVLDKNSEAGIVTCEVQFFGERQDVFDLPQYSLGELLCNNIIICSSFFRRSDWEKVGGYSTEMKYGWEDYEFWLSLVEKGAQVKRLPEKHFFYRKYSGSMADSMTNEQKIYSMNVIYSKHEGLYRDNMDKLFSKILDFKDTAHKCILDLYLRERTVEKLQGEAEKQQKLIKEMDVGIRGRDEKISELFEELVQKKAQCESMANSLSWRLTAPLRMMSGSGKPAKKGND